MTHPQPLPQSNIIRLPLLSRDLVTHGGKVMADIMASIEKIFGVGRRWSAEELYTLHDICQEPTAWEECQMICAYHRSLANGSKMFPYSTIKMLESWTSLCDRARMYKKPLGVMKNPVEIQKREIGCKMTEIRARSFNEDAREWYPNTDNDRAEFNRLRGEMKGL